jgi:hypothetical protein
MPPYCIDYFGEPGFFPPSYVYVPSKNFMKPVTPDTAVVASTPPVSQQQQVVVKEAPQQASVAMATGQIVAMVKAHELRHNIEAAIAQRFPNLAAHLADLPQPVRNRAAAAMDQRATARAETRNAGSELYLAEPRIQGQQANTGVAPIVRQAPSPAAPIAPASAQRASAPIREKVQEVTVSRPQRDPAPIRQALADSPARQQERARVVAETYWQPAPAAPSRPVAEQHAAAVQQQAPQNNASRWQVEAHPIRQALETREQPAADRIHSAIQSSSPQDVSSARQNIQQRWRDRQDQNAQK